jgi:2-polyprenyl-6-methoxyphenol hydroxylase-like FAD-dependent oxidoreductase
MVGASLAAALIGSGVRALLLESVPFTSAEQPSFDERTTALGNASRRIFGALGVWEAIAPSAGVIRSIHVSDAGRFGFARLAAREQGIEAFGYVVPNRVLGAALLQSGITEDQLTQILDDTHPASFQFSGEFAHWRKLFINENDVASARERFAVSFGSCSFEEPIQDLQKLGLL